MATQKYIIDKSDLAALLRGEYLPLLRSAGNIKGFCIEIEGDFTNGDVIKAMFPNFKINEEWKATRQFELRTDCIEITGIATSDWWNAPYKESE